MSPVNPNSTKKATNRESGTAGGSVTRRESEGSTELLTRGSLPILELRPVPGGWRTPESYINLRPLGMAAHVVTDRLLELLRPEMAQKCGVPEENVSIQSQLSWVDPRGRLVWWLTARKPRTLALQEQPAIDV